MAGELRAKGISYKPSVTWKNVIYTIKKSS